MKIRMRTSLAGNGFNVAPNDVVLVNDEGAARRLIAGNQAEEVADDSPHTLELDPLKARAEIETATDERREHATSRPAGKGGKGGKPHGKA